MSFAYISHPDCLQHDMGAEHPEAPLRLRAIEDRLLAAGLLDWFKQIDAPEVTLAQLRRAHDARYLAELDAALPQSGHHHLDPDTWMNPHTLRAARRAAGAVVRAVDGVLSGEFQRAFCAVRPPGHHATRDAAMGFCFYNNAAIGVLHALEAHGLQRVALVDFDVHHGNGSEHILAGDERVLMVSTFQHPLYPDSGTHALADNMCNWPLPAYSTGAAMRSVVEQHWLPALQAFRPELIVICAGFDAHREDEVAQLGWTEADYTWLSRQLLQVATAHAGGRIVSTLEGGYAPQALARSVLAHVRVLSGFD